MECFVFVDTAEPSWPFQKKEKRKKKKRKPDYEKQACKVKRSNANRVSCCLL